MYITAPPRPEKKGECFCDQRKHSWLTPSPQFKPFVLVATGSGIAPCLSFLQIYPDWPVRVIWSARTPEVTYGKAIMEMVLHADPHAIIIDTKKTGRPDLPAIIYGMYKVSTYLILRPPAPSLAFLQQRRLTNRVLAAAIPSRGRRVRQQ